MRGRKLGAVFALALSGVLLLSGCGGDDGGDGGATGGGSSTYHAVLNGVGPGGESGSLQVVIPSATSLSARLMEPAATATGSLQLFGAALPIALSGTYDAGAVPSLDIRGSDAGNEYVVTGNVSGSVFQGSFSGPGTPGTFNGTTDTCLAAMLGDWQESLNGSQTCTPGVPSDYEAVYYVRFVLNAAGTVTGTAGFDDGICQDLGTGTGSCSGSTYTEPYEFTDASSGCTIATSGTVALTFAGNTYTGTDSGADVYPAACEGGARTCTFAAAIQGARTNSFPTCVTSARSTHPAGARRTLAPKLR